MEEMICFSFLFWAPCLNHLTTNTTTIHPAFHPHRIALTNSLVRHCVLIQEVFLPRTNLNVDVSLRLFWMLSLTKAHREQFGENVLWNSLRTKIEHSLLLSRPWLLFFFLFPPWLFLSASDKKEDVCVEWFGLCLLESRRDDTVCVRLCVWDREKEGTHTHTSADGSCTARPRTGNYWERGALLNS